MHNHAQYLTKFKFSQSINQDTKNDKWQASEFSQKALPFTSGKEADIIKQNVSL